MTGPVFPGPIRLARESDVPEGAPDLLHALATDPDGVFAAGEEGEVAQGLGAGVVRGDVLQVVHLEVARAARGKGAGAALWSAVRSYGASRGARAVEFARPADKATLGFLLAAGIPIRGLALRLRALSPRVPAEPQVPLVPVTPGVALTGWIADLDRETRGFPRSVDWRFWGRGGSELLAMRRHGRPVAIAALTFTSRSAVLGPIAAATPEAASEFLLALTDEAIRRGATRVEVTLPSEARLPLAAALRASFRFTGDFPLLGGRGQGDLRRYAASPTAFF